MKTKKEELLKKLKISKRGITLVALAVTIILLLMLARSKYFYGYGLKWNITTSKKSKRTD